VVRERNRGGALIALIVNSISTFGMMLILTYQLQAVMGYSALRTGLALVPFAIGAALAAAVLAPQLEKRIAPRWLIAAGIVLSAAGLLPLVSLTPASRYLPLILTATIIEGIGTGLGGPPMLQTSLRAVLPSDTGAASAAGSTASQLGSSIGAALLNTIAATATVGYLATHAGASVAATVHGYTTAMAWGAGILLFAAIPAVTLINAKAPSSETVTAQAT
jgi:predicted MFS family arabinose efflux permease